MPRATNNPASRRRRKKVLKRAKGFVGGRRKLFRTAMETVERARRFATAHRRRKKREMRQLWTIRINAACREQGFTYSRFISGLKKNGVVLDRKLLSEIATNDQATFRKLVDIAQSTK
jgi:large subunit ribosomal protein L20